jgi:hypothetical protein
MILLVDIGDVWKRAGVIAAIVTTLARLTGAKRRTRDGR